jgi:hypothetical protein
MTNEPIIPSVLTVKSIGVDVSNDLKIDQTKSIAQCLYDQNNTTKIISSEKKQQEENNKEEE